MTESDKDDVFVGYYRAIVLNRPDVADMERIEVTCPYCKCKTEYINGRKFFICQACDQRTSVYRTQESLLQSKKFLEERERFDALDDDM